MATLINTLRHSILLATLVSTAPLAAAQERVLATANQPSLSINDVTLSEDSCQNKAFVFTVTLSRLEGKTATVHYATSDGAPNQAAAVANQDFLPVTGTLTFTHDAPPNGPQGSYFATITVPLGNRVVATPANDARGFTVTLSGAANATIGKAQGVGTMLNAALSCAPMYNAGCFVNYCGAASSCKRVNGSAIARSYCALAGLGITPSPDPNFAACQASGDWVDSDGDGFSDAAEVQGYIDNNGNGIYDPGVDIPLPGADPHVPDVYLQYDYIAASDHDHNPPASAIDLVKEAFAAHGVNLHIDPDHHVIPETDAKVVSLLAVGPSYIPDPACAGPSAKSPHQLRAIYPDVELVKQAYHYVVFGHYSSCDTASHCLVCAQDPECGGGAPPPFGATGSAEINGDDVIVSLGRYTDTGTPIADETWAGTLMHELGHNLGLKHGGTDCDNYKPNYLSVMSYNFTNNGIPVGNTPGASAAKQCLADADCGPPPVCPGPDCEAPPHCSAATHQCYRLDFSSFRYNDLTESGLNETIGLTGRPNSKNVVIWTPDGFANTYYGPTNGAPIDWNHDALYQNPGPPVDINGDGSGTLLAASNDWALAGGLFTRLNFDFQCTSNFAAQNQPTSPRLFRSSGQTRASAGPSFDWLKDYRLATSQTRGSQALAASWASDAVQTKEPNDAPVSIVEYSDFQCPYCRQAASVVRQVKQSYGDRVNIVLKQMPLPFHPHAFKAAEAAVCAGQQGKLWEYHDRIFASNDLSANALRQIASEAGLKVDEFNACLDSEASRTAVERDIAEARQLGVTGTPTFIINGRRVAGALSFEAFKQEIDRAFARENASFAPTSPSEQLRAIRAISAAAQEPQQTATTTTAGVSLSPGTVNFGYHLVGTTSNQMVETVTNSSPAPLIITDISVSGRDRRDFTPTYSFTLPVTVTPGNSIAINLTFTPALPWRAGTRDARLEIAEKKDSQHVPLTGFGVTCGGPLPACSSGCTDADGDGLNDAWEIAGGIDFNNDGVIDATNDLLLPGADPNRPNIYVKYDYFLEAGSGAACTTNDNCTVAGEVCDTGSAKCVKHSHAPSAAALNTVRTAFSNHGVILTYFNDPSAGGRAEALTEHIDPLLNHTDSIVSFANAAQLAASPECAGPGGVSFYDLKGARFSSRMAAAYHYSVFSHYSQCDESLYVGVSCLDDTTCQAINPALTCDNLRCSNASHCSACPTVKSQPPSPGSWGVAENSNFEGGNDLIVSLGPAVDQGLPITDTIVAGAFMHELGHNLGLTHGGGTGPGNGDRYKPNYISVMGYSYALTGIGMTSAPGPFSTTTIDPSVTRRIDYSDRVLPTLFEYNFDENVGIGGPPTLTDVAVFWANSGTCKVFAPTNGSPVDWDIAPPVNSMGQCLPYTAPPPYNDSGISLDISANGSKTALAGWSDWDHLFMYKFQCSTDGLADGAPIGSTAAASHRQNREPALQDGELTFKEAFARHIIYPQRRVEVVGPGAAEESTAADRGGHLVVTLLGSADLDVTQIDVSSLSYGGAKAVTTEIRDTNGDGKPDLVITFDKWQMNASVKGHKMALTGWLKNSQEFVGEVRSDPSPEPTRR